MMDSQQDDDRAGRLERVARWHAVAAAEADQAGRHAESQYHQRMVAILHNQVAALEREQAEVNG
jgi:hypothetical protein